MDDMRAKHTWDAVPSTWEYLGASGPPANTAIDLYVTLGHHTARTMRSAIQSTQGIFNALPCTHVLTHYAAPLAPAKCGVTSSATCSERVAELVTQHPDTPELVGSRFAYYGVTVLLHLDDTQEQLTDDH
ncbi:hypothetical protein EDB86DRAFT_2830449 [Lactarius hatsudake]|nr:hypothetical protein EDB86DRAFT_2830449 [Lactarius hatsudake]